MDRTIKPSERGRAGDNLLLSLMPPEVAARLAGRLEPVVLPAGAVLATVGQEVRSVYFPLDTVLSLLHTDVNGSTVQVALLGREGMVGLGCVLSDRHLATCVVLTSGTAMRLGGRLLRELFESESAVREVLLSYGGRLLTQAWQTVVCNRHHSPESQLCMLLLLVLDRAPQAELALTHETIARLFGLRRETISQAAMRVQERGYVRYSRGHIKVLDRAGLQSHACACYERLRPMLPLR
ncbi:Crp/Fnr family transcriptional regulator [Ramlibacter tataouinensis]|uniref:Crp/Fnr family transcriptional regulator n=1 Tax=Ramlibacter tataouinensis TaxID=94132 RepID=UPI0022F39C8B|nr:Crp/Fnr family transcriptional regulator [Ramlibacter tataouinensis]WBY02450.1 Crp/Fnr family transcriptional regulator [Ramlibacter tataouinensis]